LLQRLGIHKYACGLKLGTALNLNQNLFFQIASSWTEYLMPKFSNHQLLLVLVLSALVLGLTIYRTFWWGL